VRKANPQPRGHTHHERAWLDTPAHEASPPSRPPPSRGPRPTLRIFPHSKHYHRVEYDETIRKPSRSLVLAAPFRSYEPGAEGSRRGEHGLCAEPNVVGPSEESGQNRTEQDRTDQDYYRRPEVVALISGVGDTGLCDTHARCLSLPSFCLLVYLRTPRLFSEARKISLEKTKQLRINRARLVFTLEKSTTDDFPHSSPQRKQRITLARTMPKPLYFPTTYLISPKSSRASPRGGAASRNDAAAAAVASGLLQ